MKSRLKVILAERGIRQTWLAEKVGLSKKQLSLIVNNQAVPSLDAALRIAETLHLKVEDIWERE